MTAVEVIAALMPLVAEVKLKAGCQTATRAMLPPDPEYIHVSTIDPATSPITQPAAAHPRPRKGAQHSEERQMPDRPGDSDDERGPGHSAAPEQMIRGKPPPADLLTEPVDE